MHVNDYFVAFRTRHHNLKIGQFENQWRVRSSKGVVLEIAHDCGFREIAHGCLVRMLNSMNDKLPLCEGRHRKSTWEGFLGGSRLFGGYFWNSFPCKNPNKNHQANRKKQEKPKKMYIRKTYFSSVFHCDDPRCGTQAPTMLQPILLPRQ